MIKYPNADQSESILKRTSGDGQHDGQVQEVDHLPVPQGGLEDHERAPDHILAGRAHATNTTNSTIPKTRVCSPTFYFSHMLTLSGDGCSSVRCRPHASCTTRTESLLLAEGLEPEFSSRELFENRWNYFAPCYFI